MRRFIHKFLSICYFPAIIALFLGLILGQTMTLPYAITIFILAICWVIVSRIDERNELNSYLRTVDQVLNEIRNQRED